jgi:hypothetical protein
MKGSGFVMYYINIADFNKLKPFKIKTSDILFCRTSPSDRLNYISASDGDITVVNVKRSFTGERTLKEIMYDIASARMKGLAGGEKN